MAIIIIAQYYIAINRPAMHHAPATARAPRVCTLVPFVSYYSVRSARGGSVLHVVRYNITTVVISLLEVRRWLSVAGVMATGSVGTVPV